MNSSLSRRNFLKTAGVAAAWTVTATAAPARSANNIVRVGVIGTGVRGKYLIGNLPKSARVTAICDCATSRIAGTLEPKGTFTSVLQSFCETSATACQTYTDYRRMLDREQFDAVIIATPDHHHTLAAMLALQAGLDVYLEKPLTVSIREGRLLADMVEKTGRVLQVGSQQRTMELNRFACEFVRDGGLGQITRVELPNYPGPLPMPSLEGELATGGVDFNLFCGPTALRPHHRHLWMKEDFNVGGLLWRGWDLFRDYSGHLMTNWGAHSIDMMQYALGRDDTGPVAIEAIQPDSIEMIQKDWANKTPKPDGQHDRRFWPVAMRYADGVEVLFHGPNEPIHIYGERGTMQIRRNYYSIDSPGLITDGPDPELVEKWAGDGHVARPHLENWLDCIVTRDVPNAPVEVGHRTATVCHLANIAREINRPLRWNPDKEQFVDDEEADLKLDRPRREGFELPTE
ncbi:Gfo/Idh/MocA family oxidoreductase [Thalassoglobus sp. JC818]|uniref:Gfo/Idh/MocA family protein n=1 Tax=Thalassoglobus sp. JC818 TaxID=3232136 RepID=UPI0034578282